jgi:hypothetical protein
MNYIELYFLRKDVGRIIDKYDLDKENNQQRKIVVMYLDTFHL